MVMRFNPPAPVPSCLRAERKIAGFKTLVKGNLFKLQMKKGWESTNIFINGVNTK